MRCPKCRNKLKCFDSRDMPEGFCRRRYYRCSNNECDMHYTTLEHFAELIRKADGSSRSEYKLFEVANDRG